MLQIEESDVPKDSIKLYALGAVAFIVTGLLYWDNFTPEWKGYQDQFRNLVAKKFGAARADQVRMACSRFGSKT